MATIDIAISELIRNWPYLNGKRIWWMVGINWKINAVKIFVQHG